MIRFKKLSIPEVLLIEPEVLKMSEGVFLSLIIKGILMK